MNQFENVDVLAALSAIMKQNTAHYQTDFEIDEKIIRAAVDSADKNLLWFSRPSGTFCGTERNVFLKDTHEHNTWCFYGEQTRDKLLAYAVELSGVERGKVMGTLYELDYPAHWQHVRKTAMTPETAHVTLKDGDSFNIPYSSIRGLDYSQVDSIKPCPANEQHFQILLNNERLQRRDLAPGDLGQHIQKLHTALIYDEAARLTAEIAKKPAPDSLDKAFFTAELSTHFTRLASSKDTDQLLAALPYRNRGRQLSKRPDQSGIYLFVHKDERRDRPAKRPPIQKASIITKLETPAPRREAKTAKQKGKGEITI